MQGLVCALEGLQQAEHIPLHMILGCVCVYLSVYVCFFVCECLCVCVFCVGVCNFQRTHSPKTERK